MFGLPPEEIQAITGDTAGDEEEAFEVMQENWAAVQLFLSLSTQWRRGALGGWIGLDYPSVESTMRMLKVKDKAGMLRQVQIMEKAALEGLNHVG